MRWILAALLLIGCAPAPAAAQTPLDVGPFESVELHGGGTITIREGAVQAVRLIEGDRASVTATVDNGRLSIGRCRDCPHRRLRVEIVTPSLESLSVRDGGTIALEGRFADRPRLDLAVGHGGRIDARPLAADEVAAAIAHGGQILTHARRRLDAAVTQGGMIVYWDRPSVSPAIAGGGGVVRGRAEQIVGPVSEIGDAVQPPPLPPLPPVPPVPGV